MSFSEHLHYWAASAESLYCKLLGKLRYKLLMAAIPLQRTIQKMHPPEAQTTVKMAMQALLTMRAGDAVGSIEAWHFTNYFVPGDWGHLAIYGVYKGEPSVVEAVGEGVRIVPWLDWVIEKKCWFVARPVGSTAYQGTMAFQWAVTKDGEPYNYAFDWKQKGFWCSGLVYIAWDGVSKWTDECFTKRRTFGEWTVTPEDFYQAAFKGKLQMIHEHRDK